MANLPLTFEITLVFLFECLIVVIFCGVLVFIKKNSLKKAMFHVWVYKWVAITFPLASTAINYSNVLPIPTIPLRSPISTAAVSIALPLIVEEVV